jgi:Zn-finger nucleic acid-binding protein
VVIDICRTHGVWFDADELPRILDWVRSGKLAAAQREEAYEAEREGRRKEITRRSELPITRDVQAYPCDNTTGTVIDVALLTARWFF